MVRPASFERPRLFSGGRLLLGPPSSHSASSASFVYSTKPGKDATEELEQEIGYPWREALQATADALQRPGFAARLGGCRTWSADSENGPQRGQFSLDSQAHSPAMGQEADEKWTAAAHLQPAISKSDSLLDAKTVTVA